MKVTSIILTLALFTALSLSLQISTASADEFGDRFYNAAPAALGEDTQDASYDLLAEDDLAKALQNIAPAAGEEALESGDDIGVELEQEKPIQTLLEGNDPQN